MSGDGAGPATELLAAHRAGDAAEETAEALGSSLRTVARDWSRARAWLRVELADVVA